MTLGKGMVNSNSMKQKLNTNSSTETEVVAMHDTLPTILWTSYFLAEQGYPITPVTLHQDNMTSILLKNNRWGSSGKQIRHMNV